MKKLQPYTRRQLGKVAAVGSASIPFLASMRKSASARAGGVGGKEAAVAARTAAAAAAARTAAAAAARAAVVCFLKGTKSWTPSGDRLVQELQIGDEVQTLPVVRPLSGLVTTNSQRKKKAGRGTIT